jgi:L-fuculose-phosphate aldolase
MVVIDSRGDRLEGTRKASSEAAMHLFAYAQRPEITACVHSHAPHATAFAVAGEPLPENVLPEVILSVGPMPLTEFAQPGTKAVPDSLAPYIRQANAFLLGNHGVLTVGTTLDEACNRHETVEHYARILWLARQIGDVRHLSETDFRLLQEIRQTILDQPPASRGEE